MIQPFGKLSASPRADVIIIGGGASGVLLACNLLRHSGDLTVAIVERRDEIGRGIAYGSTSDKHLLNVPASNMSAFPEDNDHFVRWIEASQGSLEAPEAYFAPRRLYGHYLQSLLEPFLRQGCRNRLKIVKGECTALCETSDGVVAGLHDGSSMSGQMAVLATGNEGPLGPAEQPCESGWGEVADLVLRPDDPVVIIGTGLTMVDHVISLTEARHTGSILAISRRGLVPLSHRNNVPMEIDLAEVPLGAGMREITAWLRARIVDAARRGVDWRDVVDGLRPHTQVIWQSWSPETRRRFLRHARAWWDIHRHRLSPFAHARITAALAAGRLCIVAGRISSLRQADAGVSVDYVPRGGTATQSTIAARVIDCTGNAMNPLGSANPLIQAMLSKGSCRPDATGVGLDVAPDLALVAVDGQRSRHLFAIGPVTRAAFWESTAIPDIRVQSTRLSRDIIGKLRDAERAT